MIYTEVTQGTDCCKFIIRLLRKINERLDAFIPEANCCCTDCADCKECGHDWGDERWDEWDWEKFDNDDIWDGF